MPRSCASAGSRRIWRTISSSAPSACPRRARTTPSGPCTPHWRWPNQRARRGGSTHGRALGLALGLSSGDVLAGRAGASSEGDQRAATLLGEAVNQAAWLARQAGDGVILAAEPVRRLTGSLFELVAWPTAQPEGAASFAVYQVLGTRAGDVPRWQAPGYQAPLIGRVRELEELQDAWRLCRQGRGQVVSVVGEAGSGKSRLLHEFRQGLGDDGVRWLAAACPSSYAPGPYELVADLFRGLLGLAPALDGPDVNRQLSRGPRPRARGGRHGGGSDGRRHDPGRNPRGGPPRTCRSSRSSRGHGSAGS